MRRLLLSRHGLGAACLWLLLLGAVSPTQVLGLPKGGTESREIAPVDLNQATVEGLTVIPGVGEVTARRIVTWREQHGPFRRVEDLMKVKGIGEKSFEKLRPYVKVTKIK